MLAQKMTAVQVILAVLLILVRREVGAAHHRPTALAPWSEHEGTRHHLRHRGQDALTPNSASSLDQLINRLDSLNRIEPPGTYWKQRTDDDRAALDEMRQAVEEYERGDSVRADAKQALAVVSRKHPRPLVSSPSDAKRRHRGDDDDDVESMMDEDDKEEDDEEEEEDEEDVSEEDDTSESKEVDEDAASQELDDIVDMDYKDNSQALSDSPPALSSYSEQKWKSYGSRESLAYTRRHGLGADGERTLMLAKEARDHMRMMVKEGACKVPRPILVRIKDEYPNPSKEYIPHCTILHKCTNLAGCCRNQDESCQPKHSHKVSLAFFTTRVGHPEPIVEKFDFYNDSECHCVRQSDQDLGQYSGGLAGHAANGLRSSLSSDALFRKQRQARNQQLDMPPSFIQVAPYNKAGCRCPSTFSPRELPHSKGCSCDCFDRQTDCLRYKRGKDYFSWEDRLCIQEGQCKLPECEFGSFMKLSGRCPKKNEKFYLYRRP